MKYYLLVGEASGDLHASRLMSELRDIDPEAEFRYFGGDMMHAVGGTLVRHYRDTAFMGFMPVLTHLPTIFRNMRLAKRDIMAWGADVVIAVDYAGFNLSICKYLTTQRRRGVATPHTYYYIAPKIWAWKEWRIRAFRRDVEKMFCILPFEVDFFEGKHNYHVDYVGNPTADEIRAFRSTYDESREAFCSRHGLDARQPIVALLAGSRIHEIRGNLPVMLRASAAAGVVQRVVAAAPAVSPKVYAPIVAGSGAVIVRDETYALLTHATAALVTSGTATLETALLDVPQVVCYRTAMPRIYRWAFEHIITCQYISLVNLIAGREVVEELFADRFTLDGVTKSLLSVLPGGSRRESTLAGYADVWQRLGTKVAPREAARLIAAEGLARDVNS